MKIIFDDQIFIDQKWGGISNIFINYINLLKKKNKIKVYLPFIFTLNKNLENRFYIPKNLFTYTVVKYFNKILLKFYLSFFNYNFLHLTYFRKDLTVPNKKIILSIPDMIPERNKKYFKNPLKVHPFKKELALKAQKIVTLSKTSKKYISQEYSINKNKIFVIYPSIKKTKKIKMKLNLPNNYLLYVGTREGYKRFDLLLKVFSKISKVNKNLYLICIGSKFNENEIKLIKKLKIDNKVLFFNNPYVQKKNFLYQNAICKIFPSIDEGFGIPIIEAFANKCPVILSDTEIFKEVAGKFGIFFKKNSQNSLKYKIEMVIKNNHKFKKKFNNVNFNLFFKKYSTITTVQKLIKLYT